MRVASALSDPIRHRRREVKGLTRDEAAMMGEFIRDADPRRPPVFTMANHHLMDMMRDIKTITGTFQDPVVADLLTGVGIPMTPDGLKKLRNRFGTRERAWTMPRYLRRPVSRITMDDASSDPHGT